MKKLCTYLTLFVLGLLAFAQPAAAVDFTQGTVYYIDASAWTGETINSIQVWDGNDNVNATVVSGKIYSYTQSATKAGPIYIKRNSSQDKQVEVAAASSTTTNCIKINSSWNAYEWTTYTEPTPDLYIAGAFITSSNWGQSANIKTMTWNETEKVYIWDATSGAAGNEFMISWSKDDMWSHKFACSSIPTSKPSISNVTDDNGNQGDNLSLPAPGVIKYDPTLKALWVEEPAVEPTDLVFYFQNSNNWSKVRFNFWNFTATESATPVDMTLVPGTNVWKYTLHNVTKKGNFNFTNGDGTWTTETSAANYVSGMLYGPDGKISDNYVEPTAKPVLTANPAGGEFETSVSVTLSATPACDIYYTTDGSEPSATSSKYSSALSFTATTTLKAVAILNGVSSDVITYIYTKKEAGVYTGKLYVKGPGHSDWTYKELTSENGVFSFNVANVHTTFDNQNGQFVISDDETDSKEHIFHAEGQDTYFEIPVKTNAATLVHPTTDHGSNQNFYVPAAAAEGKVYIDMNTKTIWYEPKQETLPTALWVKGTAVAAGSWEVIQEMTPTGNEGEFSFTAVGNGEFVISTVSDPATFDNYAYDPATGSGVVLIAASPASTPVVHSHTSGHNFRVPGNFKVVFNAKTMQIWYIDNTRTDVFVEDNTYYVDCRNIKWFPGTSAVLGIKWEGEETIHYQATITTVEDDVYSFKAPRNMEYITIGRRSMVDGKFYNERVIYIDTTKPGTNCIQLREDGSSTSNVGYDWTNYVSSAVTPLYVLGSWLEGSSWGDNTPIAMDYDPQTGEFSYVVEKAAGANNPVWFAISKGASKTDFFNAANEYQYTGTPYLRFSEPSYINAKQGHQENRNFGIISAGTIKAKYGDKDGELKVWYTPADGRWPALYALGASISDNGKDGQWKTRVTMTPSATQPGLYTYDLDEYFCDLGYTAEANADGVQLDEKGHFNFSFFPDYNSGIDQSTDNNAFWKNAFVPDGAGIGLLNRDGVPYPFDFRESYTEHAGGWVSTNFVFAEKCVIYVDVVRQLVWVQPKTELSTNQVVFDFWDKGGVHYPASDGYQWWKSSSDYFVQAYLRDAAGNESETYLLNFVTTDTQTSDLNSTMPEIELEDNVQVPVGVRYHFIATLPASYYDDKGNVKDGYHIWIRIKNGATGSHSMERPYAYQATYTQGPKGDVDYNHYGNVLYAGLPIVDMTPSVRMIPADVEAPDHLGKTRSTQVMHYRYVNQFRTAIRVNADGFPFYVENVTEPYKHADGSAFTEDELKEIKAGTYEFVEGDVFKPVDGAPVFSKTNEATLYYGDIREHAVGTTGVAYMTGVDHANAKEDDRLEVIVTYTSEGLTFSRKKEKKLVDASESYDLLPTMRSSKEETSFPMGTYDFLGSHCSGEKNHSLDLLFDQSFDFRDIMTGAEGDNPRAAFIGYEILLDETCVNDVNHVAEGNEHVAESGRPLIFDFDGGEGTVIDAFDQDNWHYEAFTGKRIAVQLHHVLCAPTVSGLKGHITGKINFHLFVPVATEFTFEAGTTGEAEAREAKGLFRAPSYTETSPYRGPISADSYDSFTRNIDFTADGNVTTGVEGVNVEDAAEAPVEFYNLQGVRMNAETLAPGVYIRRQGNETTKVYIR